MLKIYERWEVVGPTLHRFFFSSLNWVFMLFGVVWFNQHQANLHVKESDPISTQKKIENIIQKEGKDWEREQKNIKWLNLHHPKQDLISLPANSISSSHISNSLSQPLPFFYFYLYFHNKSKLLKIYIWLGNKITLKKHKNKDSFISYIEKIETNVSWSL